MARLYLDADVDANLGQLLAARDHDVLTTQEVGRRRAGDEEQLTYAAMVGRILITYNSEDYLLLQRAWRHWADVWSVEPRPLHHGILAPHQSPHQSVEQAAGAIDDLIRSGAILSNRFYGWVGGRGWVLSG